MPEVYALDLAAFLDKAGDAALVALAGHHLPIIQAMVKAYTRGRGFDVTGFPNAELAAVITTATARLLSNPEQLSYDIGGVSMRGGFTGWTLAELAVLNRYRVRAA
jgi:hypothetical protein